MSWLSVKDFAAMMGISRQAVLKGIAKEKYTTREVTGRNQHGVSYEILHEKERKSDNQIIEATTDNRQPTTKSDNQQVGIGVMSGEGSDNLAEGNREKGVGNSSEQIDPPTPLAKGGLSDLPADTSTALSASVGATDGKLKHTTAETRLLEKEQKLFDAHETVEKERAWSRKEIVEIYRNERLDVKFEGVSLAAIDDLFQKALDNGEICKKQMLILGVQVLSLKTIKKWDKKLRDGKDAKYPLCLIDQKKNKSGRKPLEVSPELKRDIELMALSTHGLDGSTIFRAIQSKADAGLYVNPYQPRTVLLKVQEYRNDRYLANMAAGAKKFKNGSKPHIWRKADAYPRDIWESDGHRFNAFVQSPFWFHNNQSFRLLVRPMVIMFLDRCTGLIAAHRVFISENFHIVKTTFADGVSKWGVPKVVMTDKGGGYDNIYTRPGYYAGQKRVNETVKRARELFDNGYPGFFQSYGVDRQIICIPGNPESKSIEPIWKHVFSEFEKSLWAYTGGCIDERPEYMQMTAKALFKKYGDHIPTWETFCGLVDAWVNEWNNKTRPSLVSANGKMFSPAEMYREFMAMDEVIIPSYEQIIRLSYFPVKRVIQRDGIELNGLIYRHPQFASYQGYQMEVEYDENDIYQIYVATMKGEKWASSAKLMIPGSLIDQEQSSLAIASRAHYMKEMEAAYLQRREAHQRNEAEYQKYLAGRPSEGGATLNEIVHDQSIIQDDIKLIGISDHIRTQRQPKGCHHRDGRDLAEVQPEWNALVEEAIAEGNREQGTGNREQGTA